METVWFMGGRLRLPVELFVSLALLKAIKAIRKKSVALSHTHTHGHGHTGLYVHAALIHTELLINSP